MNEAETYLTCQSVSYSSGTDPCS